MIMGRGTYGSPNIVNYCTIPATVQIGNYCSIASEVTLLVGAEHHTEWITTSPITQIFSGVPIPQPRPADIRIGSDVWIGFGVTILGGVAVGDGAVLGTRALVREDVPPYAVVGGVPARVLRYRFTPEQIAALLAIRWWDWPEDRVRYYANLLCSPRIDEFIRAAQEDHS